MADLRLTLRLRKRWWYGTAFYVGILLYASRLLRNPDGYIEWLVERGTVIEAVSDR